MLFIDGRTEVEMKEYIAKKVNSEMVVNDSRWDKVPEMKLDYVWPSIILRLTRL